MQDVLEKPVVILGLETEMVCFNGQGDGNAWKATILNSAVYESCSLLHALCRSAEHMNKVGTQLTNLTFS